MVNTFLAKHTAFFNSTHPQHLTITRCGLEIAFDARSLCHRVIVPFDRENESVLGGSTEPYINNPLRIPAVLPEFRAQQRDKDGFSDLMLVLDYLQKNPKRAMELLERTLIAVATRKQSIKIVYPVPNRCSHLAALKAINSFLEDKTGGLRLQLVTASLFRVLGKITGLFSSIVVNHINAADAGTGNAADLECCDAAGNCVLAVEVKDRELTLCQVQDKLPAMRERGIRELLFLVRGTTQISEELTALIQREFVSGQNLYTLSFQNFLETSLSLIGEQGRREFFIAVGSELESQRCDYLHRKCWSDLLAAL